MAAAAAKAVWGDPQPAQEPVSGVQGDTSKGEPFDKGNIEGMMSQLGALVPLRLQCDRHG